MNSAVLPIFDREVYRSLSRLLDEGQGNVRLGDICATYSPPVSGAMVWAALRRLIEAGLMRPVIWHNVVNLRRLVSWPVGAALGRQQSAGGFQGRGRVDAQGSAGPQGERAREMGPNSVALTVSKKAQSFTFRFRILGPQGRTARRSTGRSGLGQ
jgi:hypothetical protein